MGEAQIDAINTLDAKFRDFQKEQGLPEQAGFVSSLARARPGRMTAATLKEALAALAWN